MLCETDTAHFQTLYETFAKRLVQFGVRSGVELEISKELMHQAFYTLLVKYEEVQAKGRNIPGWLIKTNTNLIRRELSSARRKHEIPLADWYDAPKPDTYHFPLKDLMPAGLTQRHQTILILCYEEQLSYKEIAVRMDISPGYVGVLLARARQELRKLYESEEKRLARDIHYVA